MHVRVQGSCSGSELLVSRFDALSRHCLLALRALPSTRTHARNYPRCAPSVCAAREDELLLPPQCELSSAAYFYCVSTSNAPSACFAYWAAWFRCRRRTSSDRFLAPLPVPIGPEQPSWVLYNHAPAGRGRGAVLDLLVAGAHPRCGSGPRFHPLMPVTSSPESNARLPLDIPSEPSHRGPIVI